MEMKKLLAFFIINTFTLFSPLTIKAEDKPQGYENILKIEETEDSPELINGHVYPSWGPVCQCYTYSVI